MTQTAAVTPSSRDGDRGLTVDTTLPSLGPAWCTRELGYPKEWKQKRQGLEQPHEFRCRREGGQSKPEVRMCAQAQAPRAQSPGWEQVTDFPVGCANP